jgi:hypothetical protein
MGNENCATSYNKSFYTCECTKASCKMNNVCECKKSENNNNSKKSEKNSNSKKSDESDIRNSKLNNESDVLNNESDENKNDNDKLKGGNYYNDEELSLNFNMNMLNGGKPSNNKLHGGKPSHNKYNNNDNYSEENTSLMLQTLDKKITNLLKGGNSRNNNYNL